MKLEYFQLNAFTRHAFGGNPAAVIPIETWLEDALMQQIAIENGVPMTAYIVRSEARRFHIRWFSATTEVALCGHATLAAGFVILNHLEHESGERIEFESRSGALGVVRRGDALELDLPAHEPTLDRAPPDALVNAIHVRVREWWRWHNYHLAILDREEDVRDLRPNLEAWTALGDVRLIVSAPGRDCDFVSRFFAPAVGLPEDHVTGSAHCVMMPYWAHRLGRTQLSARQLSPRGGELDCELAGARVKISGRCIIYLRGQIEILE